MTETRAPAQYCPYCGETNLWPHEDSHGAWSCRDCLRVFAVRFIGIAGRGAASSGAGPTVTAGSTESVVPS
jgi:ribosomal protein L37AE/L43A